MSFGVWLRVSVAFIRIAVARWSMRRKVANISFARRILTAIDVITVIIWGSSGCSTPVSTISTHKVEPSFERAGVGIIVGTVGWIVGQVLLFLIFLILGEVPRFILPTNLEADVITHTCVTDVDVKRNTSTTNRIVEDVVVPDAAARLLPWVGCVVVADSVVRAHLGAEITDCATVVTT